MAVFILIPAAWGILLGLVLARLVVLPAAIVVVGLVVGLFLSSWFGLIANPRGLRIVVCVCGLCLGIMLWSNSQLVNQYETMIGTTIDMEGVVVAQPSITSSGNQAVVVRPDGFTQNLRVSLFHHAYVRSGERVWIRGRIKQPENFNDFDYINYLKQKNIYAELSQARIIRIAPGPWSLNKTLTQVKQVVIERSELLFSEQTSAVILGMLIGEKEQLPNHVQQSFQKVGLVHILVVSGFNLTLIAVGVGVMAQVIGRRPADFLSLGIIWLFVILVGTSAAVTRAAVMASLLIGARLSGRLALSSVSLLFAVVVMVLINPWQLFYDIGFQLSIAATLGVLEANQLRLCYEQEGWWSELTWSSLGAIIMTAPIVAHYFGTFSVIAPLANLLVLPTVPYLMLFGSLALLPYLQMIFVPLTETIVTWQINLINWLANLWFSQIEIKPDFGLIVGYYVLIFIVISWLKFHKKSQLKESDSHGKITKIII